LAAGIRYVDDCTGQSDRRRFKKAGAKSVAVTVSREPVPREG